MAEQVQPKISNVRKMTMDDFDKLPPVVCYITDDPTDESLKNEDFIICDLEFSENNKYTFIHGFPGDNPAGMIYNDNSEIYEDTMFHKWYNEITHDCTTYPDWMQSLKQLPSLQSNACISVLNLANRDDLHHITNNINLSTIETLIKMFNNRLSSIQDYNISIVTTVNKIGSLNGTSVFDELWSFFKFQDDLKLSNMLAHHPGLVRIVEKFGMNRIVFKCLAEIHILYIPPGYTYRIMTDNIFIISGHHHKIDISIEIMNAFESHMTEVAKKYNIVEHNRSKNN